MIQLMKKQLFPEEMEVLYDKPFTAENIENDFEVKGGQWWTEDGWLYGKNPENNPGMIVSKAEYFGDVLLEFDAATVPPCTHDINVMWHGSWNEETNTRHIAYVAGLEGWWDGKIGFEKSPEYKLNAANPQFEFEAGKVYHVIVGDIGGHVFVVVDGILVLEVTDPDPIDGNKYGKIGFEAYCSYIKIKNLSVKRVTYHDDPKEYIPEF